MIKTQKAQKPQNKQTNMIEDQKNKTKTLIKYQGCLKYNVVYNTCKFN